MKKRILGLFVGAVLFSMASFTCHASEEIVEVGEYGRPFVVEQGVDDIEEEIREGEMELIAQLVEAEAGNQDLEGKRLVVDVILNRMEDGRFGGTTAEDIIFADNQFSVIKNGAFDKAAYNMQDSDFEAVRLEYGKPKSERLNGDALYFTSCGYLKGTTPIVKHGAHYFSR